MSVRPLPGRPASSRRPGQQLLAASVARYREPPDPSLLARRRLAVNLTKWLLPLVALLLLATIAVWPEIGRIRDSSRLTFQRMSTEVGGAKLTNVRYRGVDENGRPYTLTAVTAQQDGPDRINLTTLKADITLGDGTWLMLQAKQGVYLQQTSQLDLSHDVNLYRDDGTTVTTSSASIDLKKGAGAGAEPVHAEGPFGALDAQGFTLTDKGTAIQFTGPAHVILNGDTP